MPYCTVEQLTERYGAAMLIALSDRAEVPTGAVDADLIDRAIADADAVIDGYLKVRYALPLASPPRLVTDFSLRIAIYNAHAHVAAEKIVADYKEALRQLQQIAAGAMRLDLAGAEPAGSGSSEVRTNNPERPMTAETMKGYI